MSGLDQVLLDLIEGLGGDHCQRVLLSLDGAGLQGSEDLGQSHGGGLCADRVECSDGHRGLRGTDQQVLAVSDAVDLSVGGDVTGTSGEVAEDLHAGLFHQAFQLLADFAVKNCLHVLVRLDQVRHTDHAEVRGIGLHGLAGEGDVAAALLKDGLDHVDLRSQLGVRIDLDLDLAVGILFDLLLEVQGSEVPGVILRVDVADVDGVLCVAGVDRAVSCRCSRRCRGGLSRCRCCRCRCCRGLCRLGAAACCKRCCHDRAQCDCKNSFLHLLFSFSDVFTCLCSGSSTASLQFGMLIYYCLNS